MSYQSKYTGQEIDNLLDKIDSGSSKIVELGDFNYSSTQTSGAFQPNVTTTLNDSIENYDFIFVQISGVTDSNGSDKTYAADNMIYVPSVVAHGYSDSEAKGYNLGCHWAEKYLSCYLCFLSPTELKINWAAVKTYCYLTVGKIYGIKLNGGSSNKEIYSTEETQIGTWIDNKPLYRKVVLIDGAVVGTVSAGNSKVLDHEILDAEYIAIVESYLYINTSGDYQPLNTPSRYAVVNATGIKLVADTTIYATSAHTFGFVIHYTKTTDSAN